MASQKELNQSHPVDFYCNWRLSDSERLAVRALYDELCFQADEKTVVELVESVFQSGQLHETDLNSGENL